MGQHDFHSLLSGNTIVFMSLEWTELAYSTDWGQKSGPAFIYEVRVPSLNQKVYIAAPHNPNWKIRREAEGT